MTGTMKSTLMLGVGNIIVGDEGFGVHVVRRLKGVELPEGTRIEEGGVGGFNLLGSLEGVDRVIVVDVMMSDTAPGEVLFFKPGPDFQEPDKKIISFHQVGVLELVQMRNLLGDKPEVYFLVTRPEKLEWGTGLSESVQSAVDRAVALIKEISTDNFAGLERSLSPCM